MERRVLLKSSFVVLSVVAVIAITVPRFLSGGAMQLQQSGPAASLPSDDLRLRTLEARLDRIDGVLEKIAGQAAARSVANTGAYDPKERELSSSESAAAMELERKRQVSAYANAFHSQKMDPKWGLPKEALLRDKMSSEHILSIQANLPISRDIQCRADMCQMKFNFSNAVDAIDWADAYVADLGSALGRAWYTYETRSDGSTEIVMYGFK